MPSSTFFNLPESKRERLLQAARTEFGRVPYAETAISRIIRQAGIPRGSFYMYFADKGDLFLYILHSYGSKAESMIIRLLEQERGDLFAAFLAGFDHVQEHLTEPDYQELERIVSQNHQLRPNVFLAGGEAGLAARLREKIDLSLLDLRDEEELSDVLHLLIMAAGGALVCPRATPESLSVSRARLVRLFGLLQRGVGKNTPCKSL